MIEKKQIEGIIKKLKDENKGDFPYTLKGEFDGFIFEIEDDFGGEGQGDHCYMVFKVYKKEEPLDFTYVKIDGYYSSWYGSYWNDEFEIVEPYTKEVRAWRSVND